MTIISASLFRSCRLVAVGSALCLPLLAQSAQAQARLDAQYTASLAGIPVGKGTWAIEIGDDQYGASAQGGTAGLLKSFSQGAGTGSVQGRVVNGALVGQSYQASTSAGKKSEQIRINLQNGNVKDFAIEPAPPIARAEAARPDLPPQPPGHGTGNGILGVLPASSLPPASSQAMAYAAPQAQPAPPPTQFASASSAPASSAPESPVRSAVARSGWIIQVGALDSEAEAQKRIEAARSQAQGMLSKADPFTESVSKGDKTLIRARFAGLDRDQAEAVCKKLKRADISCMTVHN